MLVLDDMHLLDSPPRLDAIVALTDHVPEGSQLALSARGHGAFPLGALRAQGLALEIGPDELRLDEAEARQLLRAAGPDLAHDDVAELTEHMEGWTAGLYLAAIPAKASGAVEGATRFRGDDHFLADYLRSELLSQLPLDELLPDPDRCRGAHGGSALRRRARSQRLGGTACGARAFQSVRGCAGPQ